MSAFDWLEGATGVRLLTGVRDRGRFMSVTGDVDDASLEVIQTALRDAIDDSTSVELDLRGVHPLAAGRGVLITWAQARAAERNVKLIVRSPGRSTSPRPSRARAPRTAVERAGARGELLSHGRRQG